MKKIRVIIGRGPATEAYRSTLKRSQNNGWTTILIGEKEGLWGNIEDHKMGQPSHLTHLPGQDRPAFQRPVRTTDDGGLSNFHDSKNFYTKLRSLSDRNNVHNQVVEYSDYWVTKIFRLYNGKIAVEAVRKDNHWTRISADEVIIATGIPPQQQLDPKLIRKKENKADNLGFTQIQEGIEYLDKDNRTPIEGLDVALYGGGATAAWVANKITSWNPKDFNWYARPGGSEFSGAILAGSRNATIMAATEKKQFLAQINSITYLKVGDIFNGKKLLKPKLELNLSNANESRLVDQVLYSIGTDTSNGIGKALDTNLLSEISPIRDHNRVLGSGEDVLAWGTLSRDLLIIGAASNHFSSSNQSKKAAPMSTLPFNAQVPDGIAVGVSTISALNNHIPIRQDKYGRILSSNVNINLADRNQLAVYIAAHHPHIQPIVAEDIVARVIRLRSMRIFGIKQHEFDTLIDTVNKEYNKSLKNRTFINGR